MINKNKYVQNVIPLEIFSDMYVLLYEKYPHLIQRPSNFCCAPVNDDSLCIHKAKSANTAHQERY